MKWLTRLAWLAVVGILLLIMTGCPLIPPEPPEGRSVSTAANLELLVVLYTGATPGISAVEVSSIKEGLELARLFFWRNSQAKLNLTVHYLEIGDEWPLGTSARQAVEADLRRRGIEDNEYDAVYVISESPSMEICFGGGCYTCWAEGATILGQTAVAFGRVCGVPFPGRDPGVDYVIAWCFTHEFQHNLDMMAAQSGHFEMLHGHLEDAHAAKPAFAVYDAGTHYDWQAFLLREFDAYDDFRIPWSDIVSFDDADRDGLPDDDPRFPMDERRFGSNPNTSDSDGDGLGDLEEFCSGIFSSSDPQDSDSDGDGIRDGDDTYPIYPLTEHVRAASPTIDGVIETSWTPLQNALQFSDEPSLDASLYAAWDVEFLYLAVEANMYFRLFARIDGSGEDGPFQGGDTYEVCAEPALSSVRFVGSELSPHSGWQPWSALGTARVAARESGGTYTIEVAIPRDLGEGFGYGNALATGLSLRSGQVVGLDVTLGGLRNTGWADDRFDGRTANFFEMHTYADVVLTGSSPSPATSLLLTDGIPYVPVDERYEEFFDRSVELEYLGGSVLLSANADGTGEIMVDDELECWVVHPDTSTAHRIIDFTQDCAHYVLPLPPQEISDLLEYGRNQLRFVLRDQCGGNHGSTRIYISSP